jgi:purine-binding chemotaxis protein CheW
MGKERGVDHYHTQRPPLASGGFWAGDDMLANLKAGAWMEHQRGGLEGPFMTSSEMAAAADTLPSGIPAPIDEQYLFIMLAGQEYALKAEYVQSVERLPSITPVPNTAPWVLGVVHLHGVIVSVVDLRAFWGLGAIPPSPRTRLIVAQAGEMTIALVVDSVVEMRVVPHDQIQDVEDPDAIPSWVKAVVIQVALVNNRVVLLLDVERLFSSEQMQQYVIEE